MIEKESDAGAEKNARKVGIKMDIFEYGINPGALA